MSEGMALVFCATNAYRVGPSRYVSFLTFPFGATHPQLMQTAHLYFDPGGLSTRS